MTYFVILKSDIAKKAAEFGGEAANQAKKAAESVSKQAHDFSETKAFRKVSENVKAIKENIDEATQLNQIRPYKRPAKLRKRSEIDETQANKVYESNE